MPRGLPDFTRRVCIELRPTLPAMDLRLTHQDDRRTEMIAAHYPSRLMMLEGRHRAIGRDLIRKYLVGRTFSDLSEVRADEIISTIALRRVIMPVYYNRSAYVNASNLSVGAGSAITILDLKGQGILGDMFLAADGASEGGSLTSFIRFTIDGGVGDWLTLERFFMTGWATVTDGYPRSLIKWDSANYIAVGRGRLDWPFNESIKVEFLNNDNVNLTTIHDFIQSALRPPK